MNNYISIIDRIENFAIKLIKACIWLNTQGKVAETISDRLLHSGTLIGTNITKSRSAQSNQDFLSKIEIAVQNARETEYWLRLLVKSELVESKRFNSLLNEAIEISKILATLTKKIQNIAIFKLAKYDDSTNKEFLFDHSTVKISNSEFTSIV